MIRFYFALLMGKLSRIAISILRSFLHTGGSHFPGQLAIKLCPNFLSLVGKPQEIICVTGTNGKTTLSNLISDIYEDKGISVVSNRAGSNMAPGVATALLLDVTLGNRPRSKVAVLEIDEKSSTAIYKHITPNYLVVTQLVRDSMMRNAHPYYILDIINKALPDSTKLILNADDIISTLIKPKNARVYYSISKLPGEIVKTSLVNDARVCPKCNGVLKYDFTRYGHIGRATCPDCGYASPEGKYTVTKMDTQEMHFDVRMEDGSIINFPLISDSIFNTYDELAAIAFFGEYGFTPEETMNSLAKLKVVDSRYMNDEVAGVEVVSNMTKSLIAPACSAVFDYVRSNPKEKEIAIFIEDPHTIDNNSYMYDTDFEYLNDPLIKKIIIVGKKPQEFYQRFLFAGVPRDKMVQVSSVDEIVPNLSLKPGTAVYLLYDNYQVNNNTKARKLVLDELKKRAEGQTCTQEGGSENV